MSKAFKSITVLRKLQNIVPRNVLLKIDKHFIGPHLDDGDSIYQYANKEASVRKLNLFITKQH